MFNSLGTSCGRERKCSLYEQASKAMAHKNDRPLECIGELAIRAKLSHETIRER